MNIEVRPDLSGAAPLWASYYAIDRDTYDGAPDSTTRNHIGYGETEAEAVADLRRLLDEIAEVAEAANAAEPEEPLP